MQQSALLNREVHVFNLECLSRTNPNPPDSGICRKRQNKSEVDLLNIVQLKLALRKREREKSSLVNPPPALFSYLD